MIQCSKKSSSINQNLILGALVLNQRSITTSTNTVVIVPEDTADTVVSAPNHNGDSGVFRDQTKAVNGIRGAGRNSGSLDVFSLATTGVGASIVLEWKGKRILNGTGIDFIVFENPFLYNNTTSTVFMEPLIVEVSNDNTNYCGFSPNYVNSPETVYSNNPSNWSNFAGLTPVLYNIETNPLTQSELYTLSKTGGDGFDLDTLSANNDFNIGCNTTLRDSIRANGFIYLRLTSASARINPDTSNFFLQDSGALQGGSDIDGVIARYRTTR
jgi:hypothetical protein